MATTKKRAVSIPTPASTDAQGNIIASVDEIRDMLAMQSGASFVGFSARYDLIKKMVKKHRETKEPNPWLDSGVAKLSTTTILVSFDYDASLQRRTDGEEQAAGGPTWQQALIVNGRLTPLTVHSEDVEEHDGHNVICKPNARCYLRGEFRSSESKFVMPDGEELNAEKVADLKQYLPIYKQGEVVKFRTVCLNNIESIRFGGTSYVIR